ncbi:hypothetical protein [Bordetella sp. LUAb4]|uniref:hypothetical protein n=1 Tax=Bordetella sp. LUAb4 TaxID=2843195 RepID=UPI001E385BEA|nr:hypothetical protein [Bordetella sp. LUAb4]
MNDQCAPCADRGLAEKAFLSGNSSEICKMLVSIAFYDSDWNWVQDRCLEFLASPVPEVRGVAATCLGHIARIHHCLDRNKVLSALDKHSGDASIAGQISDALDDIAMFVPENS